MRHNKGARVITFRRLPPAIHVPLFAGSGSSGRSELCSHALDSAQPAPGLGLAPRRCRLPTDGRSRQRRESQGDVAAAVGAPARGPDSAGRGAQLDQQPRVPHFRSYEGNALPKEAYA